MDLENKKRFEKIFSKYKFSYVINCAAYTNLDYCEKNYNKIKKINCTLPKILSEKSFLHKFKLVHLSSDQVYLNFKNTLSNERSTISAINNYARSKIISERYVKKNKNNLIIRTNFTGFKKRLNTTFIGWILFNIRNRKKIGLFNDLYTSTIDVKTCAKIILRLIKVDGKGIYNLGTHDTMTKKDFALTFTKQNNLNIKFTEISCKSTKVKRSNFLGLDVKKIEKKLKLKMISSKNAANNLSKGIKK